MIFLTAAAAAVVVPLLLLAADNASVVASSFVVRPNAAKKATTPSFRPRVVVPPASPPSLFLRPPARPSLESVAAPFGRRLTSPRRRRRRSTEPPSSPLRSSSSEDEEGSSPSSEVDVSSDPRLYRVRLPRAPGIEWGTDLSFSFVRVRELDPSGPASLSGEVSVGDQICELRAVVAEEEGNEGGAAAVNLIGAPFDAVMGAFASLDRTVREVDLVFFRGTKDELKTACAGENATEESETITITVLERGDPTSTRTITAKAGCNVREVLVSEGINVYQSLTRWTNCKGKQLCGTCIVNVTEGGTNTNRKSMDEESTLRENPDGYRLSCVTFAYGDVTVETFPPVKASQWTR